MTRAASRPPRFVALLRGINVGKANRVPMAEWRRSMEARGFSEVKTLLNSGNAVFGAASGGSSAAHAATIAEGLASELGVDVRVVVRSAAEFAAAIAGLPVAPAEAEHSRLLVAFAQKPDALRGLSALQPLARASERFEIRAEAAYLHCSHGILASCIAGAMLGPRGRDVTTRNWATVLKIQALLA